MTTYNTAHAVTSIKQNHPLLFSCQDALRQVVPSLEPSAVVLPVTRLPGLGLPSVVPVPNLQRLYFKMCEPVDTRQLTFAKNDADAWQQLYNEIKATGKFQLRGAMSESCGMYCLCGSRGMGMA